MKPSFGLERNFVKSTTNIIPHGQNDILFRLLVAYSVLLQIILMFNILLVMTTRTFQAIAKVDHFIDSGFQRTTSTYLDSLEWSQVIINKITGT